MQVRCNSWIGDAQALVQLTVRWFWLAGRLFNAWGATATAAAGLLIVGNCGPKGRGPLCT
eukprot:4393572-Amphidinium_carterae.1